MIRAKHTAKIINVKDKEIIIDNRLEERNPGSLSGKSLDVTNRDEYWNYYMKYNMEQVKIYKNSLKEYITF